MIRKKSNHKNARLDSLMSLQKELTSIENNFEYLTDPILIESHIYHIKAIQTKHQYLLREYKKSIKEPSID